MSTMTLDTGARIVVPSVAEVGTVITLPVQEIEPDQDLLDSYDHDEDAKGGDEYNLSQKMVHYCGHG